MIGVAGFQSQMFLPNHLKARPLQEMHSIYSRFENFQFLFKMILQVIFFSFPFSLSILSLLNSFFVTGKYFT